MRIEHIELTDANAFIAQVHRHHKLVVGHRFSLAAFSGGELAGVAVIGRPVARMTDQRMTVEVTRLATNGRKNACSFLYAAAARAATALGYAAIQTFILASEPGTSLIAAGWKCLGPSSGGDWNRPSRAGRRVDQPQEAKVKWGKMLHENV